MNKIQIYKETALSQSKEKNLVRRAEIFDKHYIPYLKKLAIFLKGNNCIELGCGYGDKLQKLINHFPDINYVGLDNSENMLNRAKRQLPDIKFILGDIINMIEIGDNTQDVVCLFQVLQHLNLEDRTKVYNEINRILKPNGYIIVIASTPPESNKLKIAIWNIVKKFYAVLSQYPDILLRKRINEAIKSILFPSNYNSEDFGYFPINFDTMLGTHNELELIQSVTPKIIGNTIPCISDMHIFKKTIT